MERKIFKEDLCKKGTKRVDWENSVGRDVRFVYGSIYGTFKIIKYIKQKTPKIVILYCKNEYEISINCALQCRLEYIVTDRTKAHKCKIGDVINGLLILNNTYKSDKKAYIVKCVKDGYEYTISENNISKGCGCPVCKNRVVIDGINDVCTTHPHLVKYFKHKHESKQISKGSRKKVVTKCPYCEFENSTSVQDLTKRGFSCKRCGDGFSYPNKFMLNILIQLGLDFIAEYSPEWVKPRRYDFYIPSKNLIIEMDGGFHYQDNSMSGQTKRDSQNIDKWKDNQAKKHGNTVVRVDCNYNSKTDKMQYMKYNVQKALSEYLNLTNLDFKEVNKKSLESKVIEVCKLWNNGFTTLEISEISGVSCDTARNYLRCGTNLEICEYTPNSRRTISEKQKKRRKPIEVLRDGVSLGIFESATYIQKHSCELFGVRLLSSKIASVCTGNRLSHKGFTFRHAQDFEREYDNQDSAD